MQYQTPVSILNVIKQGRKVHNEGDAFFFLFKKGQEKRPIDKNALQKLINDKIIDANYNVYEA